MALEAGNAAGQSSWRRAGSLVLLASLCSVSAFVPPPTAIRIGARGRVLGRSHGPIRATGATGAEAGDFRPESGPREVSDVRIRRATKSDLSQVAAMQLDEYGQLSLWWPWHWVQELDRLQSSYWYDAANHAMIVAEKPRKGKSLLSFFRGKTKVVGFVSIDWRAARVDKSTPADVPYLSDLIIDKAHRKQGVGRALMTASETLARRLGFSEMYLKVRRSNQAGINLYVALGYQMVEELDNGILVMRRSFLGEEPASSSSGGATAA